MKIGIIGMGHLGKATLEGLLKSGVAPEEIFVNARTEKTLKALEEAYPGIAVRSDKRDLVSNVEVLIIIVRPQDASEVMSELKGFDLSNKTLISLIDMLPLSRTLKYKTYLGVFLCQEKV